MNQLPNAASDFLGHYEHDARLRWSPGDLAAQQSFVHRELAGKRWLDWSSGPAALELLQAALISTAIGERNRYDAVLLSGPIVELLEPGWLFATAANYLRPDGSVIGIIPCLRDNSPESCLFADLSAEVLQPYATAEEIIEILCESGLKPQGSVTQFFPIHAFTHAVLKDELAFKGFRQVFNEVEIQGYDPIEVGWGELRFVARLAAAE